MQTNQPNAFQFSIGKPNKPIPGLKVAYGSEAQQQVNASTPSSHQGKNLFSRLKEGLWHLVTEEVPDKKERPIGISQLSHHTFRGTNAVYNQPLDYRFNLLVDHRRSTR